MKKQYLFGLMFLSLIFISSCSPQAPQPICNKPYLLVENECCLDQNDNSICDKDEQPKINDEPKIIEKPVTTVYDAINKVSERQDIVEDWREWATSANCAIRDLDINQATYFVTRIDSKENLIECNHMNNFNTLIKTYDIKEAVAKIENCDKSLIEDYKKVARGFESSYTYGKLGETCQNCDSFYAISFGCVNVNSKIENYAYNISYGPGITIIDTSGIKKAFALVDAKNGKVYW